MDSCRREGFPASALRTALVLFSLIASALGVRGADFRRGDANGDAVLDITDALYSLSFLFQDGAGISCHDAGDSNDDGVLDVSDAVFSLTYLFLGGREPPAPRAECGGDPTADALRCDEYAPCAGVGDDRLSPDLRLAASCDQAVEELRQDLVERMDAALDRNYRLALAIGRGGWCWWDLWDCHFCNVGPPPLPSPPEDVAEGPEEVSETNNQVDGVDEPDLVKTDGGYLYVVAAGRLHIIDAWPVPEARTIATVDIEGDARRLFVHDHRAVVYSSLERLAGDPVWSPSGWLPMASPRECTYGYDCELTGDGRRLKITVFDIADRSRPTLLRELEFNGSYVSARRIGERVYTAITFPDITVPGSRYWPEELGLDWEFCETGLFPYSDEEIRSLFSELMIRNLELIEDASLVDLLPSVRHTRYAGDEPVESEQLLQQCDEILVPQAGDGQGFLSLVSFDMDTLEDPAATSILSRPGVVYASRDSFYVATRHYRGDRDDWYFPAAEDVSEATTVHKFRLTADGSGSSYAGSGAVKGRILNQFSMDEHDGYLRVATTTGRVPSPDVHSTVAVLAEVEEGLRLVGQVDGIAPTEDIRSVRFHGEVGYVVTFQKTDPLFVLDLSEPDAPVIRGELKIPGFSTYMHILDEDHVLSIGYDADEQEGFAWFQGILLQVFDVADRDDPQLLHREVIGTRGSTSDAATDHLAFTYLRSRGLLGVPMVICEGGEGGRHGDRMTFTGLLVYRVDLATGFHLVGGVPHADAAAEADDASSCRNWWTRPNSHVKRSVFMDDHVYSVASDIVQGAHLDDLENPVSSIRLDE